MFFKTWREDIRAVKQRDPAARNALEIVFNYPGFHAVRWHRRAHWLYTHHMKGLGRFVSTLVRFFTGIEIHPGATLGRGVFIDHGMGVVIGQTAEVGNNVTIYQGATLGGTGKDTGKRHPTIEDDVVISSGAKVLGPFRVGKGSRIGAGAVVLNEVPPYCTVVGVPGRIVRRYCPKNITGEPCEECETCNLAIEASDLDQIHMPDPVEQELQDLRDKVDILEKAVTILMREAQHENI